MQVSQSYISQVENGQQNPSLEMMEKLSAAVECEYRFQLVPFRRRRRRLRSPISPSDRESFAKSAFTK